MSPSAPGSVAGTSVTAAERTAATLEAIRSKMPNGNAGSKAERVEQKYDVVLDFPNLELHSAAASGNVGLVHYALTHGQPVNSLLHGCLPLHAACSGGSVSVVRMLIERGADVNAPRLPRRYSDSKRGNNAPAVGTVGSTPMHFAAANGHVNVVQILLACGAVPNKQDKNGMTPEDLAEMSNHPEVVRAIRVWEHLNHTDRPASDGDGIAGPSRPRADSTASTMSDASDFAPSRKGKERAASMVSVASEKARQLRTTIENGLRRGPSNTSVNNASEAMSPEPQLQSPVPSPQLTSPEPSPQAKSEDSTLRPPASEGSEATTPTPPANPPELTLPLLTSLDSDNPSSSLPSPFPSSPTSPSPTDGDSPSLMGSVSNPQSPIDESPSTSPGLSGGLSQRSSRRPSLPSIFEKAAHPGQAFRAALRKTEDNSSPSITEGETHHHHFFSRGRTRTVHRAKANKQAILGLFRRGHSPPSRSPSPPKRTEQQSRPVAADQLEEGIARLKRASMDPEMVQMAMDVQQLGEQLEAAAAISAPVTKTRFFENRSESPSSMSLSSDRQAPTVPPVPAIERPWDRRSRGTGVISPSPLSNEWVNEDSDGSQTRATVRRTMTEVRRPQREQPRRMPSAPSMPGLTKRRSMTLPSQYREHPHTHSSVTPETPGSYESYSPTTSPSGRGSITSMASGPQVFATPPSSPPVLPPTPEFPSISSPLFSLTSPGRPVTEEEQEARLSEASERTPPAEKEPRRSEGSEPTPTAEVVPLDPDETIIADPPVMPEVTPETGHETASVSEAPSASEVPSLSLDTPGTSDLASSMEWHGEWPETDTDVRRFRGESIGSAMTESSRGLQTPPSTRVLTPPGSATRSLPPTETSEADLRSLGLNVSPELMPNGRVRVGKEPLANVQRASSIGHLSRASSGRSLPQSDGSRPGYPVARKISSHKEARDAMQQDEQNVLELAQLPASEHSSRSLADQLAAYGESHALAQEYARAERLSVLSTGTSRTHHSLSSGSDRNSVADSLRRNNTTGRSLTSPKALTQIDPALNSIYDRRATAYRERLQALVSAPPMQAAERHGATTPTSRHRATSAGDWVTAGQHQHPRRLTDPTAPTGSLPPSVPLTNGDEDAHPHISGPMPMVSEHRHGRHKALSLSSRNGVASSFKSAGVAGSFMSSGVAGSFKSASGFSARSSPHTGLLTPRKETPVTSEDVQKPTRYPSLAQARSYAAHRSIMSDRYAHRPGDGEDSDDPDEHEREYTVVQNWQSAPVVEEHKGRWGALKGAAGVARGAITRKR